MELRNGRVIRDVIAVMCRSLICYVCLPMFYGRVITNIYYGNIQAIN